MFSPRYNYSKGIVRPAGRRVAALSTSSKRRRRRTAGIDSGGIGGIMGAGGGSMQTYSPVYERAEDPTLAEEFLPTDTQTQNKIFRNIIMYDPIAGPATEYWRDLAFSRYLRVGGIEDTKIQQFYEDAIEASGVAPKMPWLLNDYLTFGRVVAHFVMDERAGYWNQIVLQDPDFVEVIVSPFPAEEPIINIQPSNEHRDWAVSRDPRIMEQREKYDPEVIKLMAHGEPYPLPSEHTLFMPRRAYGTDEYGTSYLTRIIPFKIMEKALIDSEIQAARRRAGPVWVIQVPDDYESDQIQEIVDQFFAIEEDAVGGKVAVREGVTVSPLGGGKADFWTLSDEYEFLKTAKMNALGISESFMCLTGDTCIPTKEHGIVRIDQLHNELDDREEQEIDLTVAGSNGEAKAVKWKYSGYADTVKVTTKQGYEVTSTLDHRFLTLVDGELVWRQANELSIGDVLCVNTKSCVRHTLLPLDLPDYHPGPRETSIKIPTKPDCMTPELAFLLGIIVSEGCHDRYRTRITNSDLRVAERFRQLVKDLFDIEVATRVNHRPGEETEICGVATKTTKTTYELLIQSKVVAGWLSYLGVISRNEAETGKSGAYFKEVPWSILQADDESQLAYIAAYIEGDGCIHKNRNSSISIFSRSITNLKQLQVLLNAHGVVATLMEDYYRLSISSVNARKLRHKIAPFMVSKTWPQKDDVRNKKRPQPTSFGVPSKFIQDILSKRFVRQEHTGARYLNDDGEEVFIPRGGTILTHRVQNSKFLPYDTCKNSSYYDDSFAALKKVSACAYKKLVRILDREYKYDYVSSLEEAGKQHVYDISMASNEEPAFVANGLVVHNSGDANYSSMEKILHVFLEKLRAIRNHFTEQVVTEKMLKNLARMHGFVHKPSTQVAHHYRIARREVTDADLIIPTVEWDKPLEPQADLDYWDLLERLETKGIPIHKRKWAQAAGYDFNETFENADLEMEDRAKLYEFKSALAKQAEDAGFSPDGIEFEGEGTIGGGLGGGLGGGGELGDFGGEEGAFDFDAGEGLGEGGGFGGEEMEAPPESPELPTPEPAGEGAGAALEKARFQIDRPRSQYRTANWNPHYQDLEKTLLRLPLWDKFGFSLGVSKRRVAQLVDEVAHKPLYERDPRTLTRFLRHHGLNNVQSGLVQYCAARLGYVPHPHIDAESIRHLQGLIMDQANEVGLNESLNREFDMLNRVAQARTKTPVAGYRFKKAGSKKEKAVTSVNERLSDDQLLSGVI